MTVKSYRFQDTPADQARATAMLEVLRAAAGYTAPRGVDRISIVQAAARGIARVRQATWAPENYLTIDIVDGRPGPWTHLSSPDTLDPVDILCVELDYTVAAWLPYAGPDVATNADILPLRRL
jgi:hypothetical protein